ncbi:hypothetical protein MP31_19370 [Escherichia coli N36254PS]|nr:hypothetical protein MP31_19370 [Escherichia coli N36254PS]
MVAGPVRWWKKPDYIKMITIIIFAGPPGGVGLNTGRAARKKAHFCDFIVIIIISVTCCF